MIQYSIWIVCIMAHYSLLMDSYCIQRDAVQYIDDQSLHQSTAASTWWCGPRPRLGWVEMAVGLPEGPSYPGHSPFIFSLCCPLNDRRRAAHSIFKIGRLFSLFLLSCLTLALLRLLILLLLLMSGNVHPNPGPIFPCSVCAGNVTWRASRCNAALAPNGSI